MGELALTATVYARKQSILNLLAVFDQAARVLMTLQEDMRNEDNRTRAAEEIHALEETSMHAASLLASEARQHLGFGDELEGLSEDWLKRQMEARLLKPPEAF